KNREFDIIEVEGDASGGASARFSPQGERKQKSAQHCQQTDERGLPAPPKLSEREKNHDVQTMNAEGLIIPRTTSSMKMGIQDATIRLAIDTTRLQLRLHT
ncbi:MAG: hypothetical protein AAB242_09120, partial [Nitrospirota bacterium]